MSETGPSANRKGHGPARRADMLKGGTVSMDVVLVLVVI